MTDGDAHERDRWARFRFSVIGPLLASPAEPGELQTRIAELAARTWRHPTTHESIRIGASTIERWFYLARGQQDPVAALARKLSGVAGKHVRVGDALAGAIRTQWEQHPRWSWKLHYDNLAVLARQRPELGSMPSYATLCRFMTSHGLLRARRRRRVIEQTASAVREVRSFEVEHVHGLWHLDFHECSRTVVFPDGHRIKPQLLGVLDDHSRLCCHTQWYAQEETETLVHGLSQAILKRGLPRGLLTDNGGAMLAAETVEGLKTLGITPYTTLSNCPEQNGKQERFWQTAEGRLLAMLDGVPELTLELLNRATQAWAEMEYNRTEHSEIKETPLDRMLNGRSVVRPSPGPEALQRAFRTEVTRKQRRSDGTITVEGVRYEVPSRYRTLVRVTVRYARWDLSSVDLVDRRTGSHLCVLFPLDKHRNADARRRTVDRPDAPIGPRPPPGMAPLLAKMLADYAATGLPPAYLPHHTDNIDDTDTHDETERSDE